MSGITEFLLARIAEDEAVAKGVQDAGEVDSDGGWSLQEPYYPGGWATVRGVWVDVGNTTAPILQPATADHLLRFDPARVLAECEAKRRIIEAAHENASEIDGEWGWCHDSDQIRSGDVPSGCYGPGSVGLFLKPLVQIYADHSDYDPAWS